MATDAISASNSSTKGHLKPFGDEADRKAIEQLETTLAEAPALEAVPEVVRQRVRAAASHDFSTLWPDVERECAARAAKEARRMLSKRGEKEDADLTDILHLQRESIEEKDQARRDRAHLEARLGQPAAAGERDRSARRTGPRGA